MQLNSINQSIKWSCLCIWGRLWNPCPLDYSDIPVNSGLLLSVLGLKHYFFLCLAVAVHSLKLHASCDFSQECLKLKFSFTFKLCGQFLIYKQTTNWNWSQWVSVLLQLLATTNKESQWRGCLVDGQDWTLQVLCGLRVSSLTDTQQWYITVKQACALFPCLAMLIMDSPLIHTDHHSGLAITLDKGALYIFATSSS